MKLFSLTLRTLLCRKTWIIALLAVGVLPFLLPTLVPHEFSEGLIEPARAQAAWNLLWAVSIFWLMGQGAKQGHWNVSSSTGLYFQSQGVGRFRQVFETWLALFLLLLPLVIITFLVSSLGAAPLEAGEREIWMETNLQFASLFILVVAPLLYVSVAMGTRFGALTGYLVSVGIGLYGLYGVGFFDVAIREGGAPFVRMIYTLSPHFHLADLTERLIFKMGALGPVSYSKILLYLLGVACVLTASSSFATRTTAR